jgi:transcriptional regulator with XRE-family HTH domain
MNLKITENLKRLRKERKLTQEDLAKFIGVSFQVISKWECGDSYPDITVLPVLAKFFNLTVDELLGAEDENGKKIVDIKEEAIEMTIDELDLTTRTINYLKRAGIITVKDLVSKTEDDIINLRNFRTSSFEEVLQKLNSFGLSFRKEAL